MSAIAATALLPSAAKASTCPTRSAAKPSRSRRSPAIIPTAAGWSRSRSASPERIAPFCPHFGVCGGCAIQHWETERYRAWKRDIVVTTLAQAGIACEVAPLVDAHGAGRRRITLHARMGTHEVLKVGFAAVRFARHRPDRPLPDPRSASRRRDRGRLGRRRALDHDGQAARHPGHGHRKRARCRCPRLRAGVDQADRKTLRSRQATPAGAADAPWRTGVDANAAGDHHRHRAGRVAAGIVPAGDGRRRGNAGGAGRRSLQARQAHRRPVLRRRPVRAAAGREIEGRRVRQRRRLDRSAASRR